LTLKVAPLPDRSVRQIQTTGSGGFVYDQSGSEDFKFISVSVATRQIIMGHRTSKGWFTDAAFDYNWNDSQMKSSYANVCNVTSTREEVVLLFGMHQAWQGGQREVTVQLSDRVVLSPFAAKRLVTLLNNVVGEYENRFGKLSTDGAKAH
jgi:hypothetical protein